LSGFLGAKVFHLLETPSEIHWETLLVDLLTSGGWTFYGGLICGAAGVIWYTNKQGMHWRNVFDAGGPAMMLSYGLGRFGCHFSGDGDWGIANLKPNPGLPDWAWAYKYPHNVLGKDYASTGMELIPGCSGEYCYQLAVPVYPTPLYEALMALGLFAIMWFVLRKRNLAPFQMFSAYMMMAGLERMLIESIREHGVSLYSLGGMQFSQAQMISLGLMLFGALGWLWAGKSPMKVVSQEKVD
jgi:prolipoprotein diacylglyceryltransferase